jgi:hypothetical protein
VCVCARACLRACASHSRVTQLSCTKCGFTFSFLELLDSGQNVSSGQVQFTTPLTRNLGTVNRSLCRTDHCSYSNSVATLQFRYSICHTSGNRRLYDTFQFGVSASVKRFFLQYKLAYWSMSHCTQNTQGHSNLIE